MKLDVKRTVLIGFAFFSICAFWQLYNSVIPLMLTNTFHMNETLSGVIMAADNVLALFLLPIFGTISDRCRHPWGKRMPFLVFGTIAAVSRMSGCCAAKDTVVVVPPKAAASVPLRKSSVLTSPASGICRCTCGSMAPGMT